MAAGGSRKTTAKAGAGGAEEDTQRRFREALERKRAKDRAGRGEDHLGGRGVGASNNDKTTRQFRRKSGG